jgi:hypothetical protein
MVLSEHHPSGSSGGTTVGSGVLDGPDDTSWRRLRELDEQVVQMGLVARYFERLGDHAVNVTRRLEQLRQRV